MRATCHRPKAARTVVIVLLAALAASTACAAPSAVSFGVGVRTSAPWGTAAIHTTVPLYPMYGPWPAAGPLPHPGRPMRARPRHWW
jgi:hypothetical protein